VFIFIELMWCVYSVLHPLHCGLYFQTQPIIQIRSASAFDSLIVLSGGSLSLYDSQSFEMKGSNSVTGVHCFAVDENPVDGDPFVVPVSRKQ